MDSEKREFAETVEKIASIEAEISRHMIGQKKLIRQVVIAVLAGGNALLEGVPGLGKTRLVRTIGMVLDMKFSRIQFTPDLMPADIVGTNIFNRNEAGEGSFRFQQGPIFSNIVLADEINRATPKTQSAMLEAMQEQTVTVGVNTYKLPQPYFVLATQNPLEMEGTYPLPEAQLDRFMFKLNVEFPKAEELKEIVNMTTAGAEEELNKVSNSDEILKMREVSKRIPIADPVMDYAISLVMATHPKGDASEALKQVKKYVRYGSSPRGAQALINSSRINALLEGRYNVSYDDVNEMAYPSLRHRIFMNFEGVSEGVTPDIIIDKLIKAKSSNE
ncbi:MAG: MoxR family ATPase [Eubacteriales bacterium]|nr:MoxR family ATPase [Eubacteriales bacterium]